MSRVSVHITSKDRSSELLACLHSLRNQTYKEWDLVLLDDQYGAPIHANHKFLHDVLNRIRQEGHGVHLLRNDISMGVCRARQKLVDEDLWKENAYILRCDDDQILDKEYISDLIAVMERNPKCGITSGVTPNYVGPDFKREVKHVGDVINKITLNDDGSVKEYKDDCGVLYVESKCLPAHNFRSSALIRRKVFDKITYEKGLTNTGFREECFLSLRTLLAVCPITSP